MMAVTRNNATIEVGAKANFTDLERQINGELKNLSTKSVVQTKIKVNGKDALKTIRKYYDELKKIEIVTKEITNMRGGTFLGNDAKGHIINGQTEKVESLKQAYDKTATSAKKTSQAVDTYNGSVKNASKSTEDLGVGLTNFWGTMKKIAEFQIINGLLSSFVEVATQSIQTVHDFDDALTDFKKVSDLTGESLKEYTQQLADMGELTSRTATEMVQAATVFKQGGYSDEDSAKLAQMATMLQNISDTEISAGDAGNFLISQMKAFSGEFGGISDKGQQALKIMDGLNEVSNDYAVSSSDLEQGLSNVAATMASGNNSYEQTLGLLTAITEVTRNASRSSRGLRQISSRLVQTLDDTSSTGQKLIKIYSDLGIELKDQDGNLRSTYDILKDLSKQWGSLGENQKQYIALTSAGSNQVENFNALMSNFDTAINATTTALNSNGSATKENAKYNESLSAKVNLLKGQFVELVTGDGGLAKILKLLTDLGIAVLKFANTDLGKLVITLAAVSAGVQLLTSNFSGLQNIMNPLVSKLFPNLISAIAKMAQIDSVSSMFAAATTAINGTTGAVSKLSVAEKASLILTAASAVALGIYGIVKVVDALTVSQKEQVEATNKSVNAFSEANSKVSELQKNINDLKENISQLKSKGKLSLTDQAQLDLLIQEREQLEAQLKIQQTQANLKRQQADADIQSALTKNGKYTTYEPKQLGNGSTASAIWGKTTEKGNIVEQVQAQTDSYVKLNEEITKYQQQLAQLSPTEEGYANQKKALNVLIDGDKKALAEMSDSISKNADQIFEWYKTYSEAGVAFQDMPKELQDAVNNLEGMTDAISNTEDPITSSIDLLDRWNDKTNNTAKSTDDIADAIEAAGGDVEGFKDAVAEGNWQEAFAIATKNAATSLNEEADSAQTAQQALQDQLGVISGLYSAYGTLAQAVADYNTNGYIEPENLQNLLKLGNDYIAMLDIENGKLVINQSAFEAYANQQYDVAEAKAYESYTEEMNAAAKLKDVDATNAATNASADFVAGTNVTKQQLADLIQLANGTADAFYNAAKAMGNYKITSQAGQAAARQASDNLYKTLRFLESGRKSIGKYTSNIRKNTVATGANTRANKANTGAKSANAKASQKQVEAEKAHLKALQATAKALQDQKEALEKQRDDYGDVIDYIKDKTNERINALQEEKDRELDIVDEEIDSLKEWGDAQDDAYDEKINKIDEMSEQAKSDAEERIDVLEKEQDKEEQYWNAKIDAFKKQNDELQEQIKLQELLDNLTAARNKRIRVYKEGQGFVYDQDNSAINEAKKQLDAYNTEQEYNKQLQALEKSRDDKLAVYKKQITDIEETRDALIKRYTAETNDLELARKKTKNIIDKQVQNLENYKSQLETKWNGIIKTYQDWLKGFEEAVDTYENEQNRLKALQLTGIDFSTSNFNKVLNVIKNSFDESHRQFEQGFEIFKEQYQNAQEQYSDDSKAFLESINSIIANFSASESNIWMKQLDSMKTISTAESSIYNTRLSNLSNFISSYSALLSKLQDITNQYEIAQKAVEKQQEILQNATDAYNKIVNDYNAAIAKINSTLSTNISTSEPVSSSGKTNYQPIASRTQTASGGYVNGRENLAFNSSNPRTKVGSIWTYKKGAGYWYGDSNGWGGKKYGGSKTFETGGYHTLKVKKYIASRGIVQVQNNKGSVFWTSVNSLDKKALKLRATGVSSIPENETALVGDNPNNHELVIGSKLNGTPINLPKGSGVVNAKSTNTLAGILNHLGELSHSQSIGSLTNSSVTNSGITIGTVNIDGSNITDINSFKDALNNLKSEAIQRAYRRT